jgi:hypothetical protein
MAFATGTATDHNDLFTKLVAFLKTNAALVAAGEAWVTAWQDSDSTDTVLRGPGLANQDQVHIGFRQVARPATDQYWLELRGMTGVVPTAENVLQHNNPSLAVRVFLDPNPMTYWFVASGRRFVGVVKVSTVYQAFYGGLFLPYATPISYGYPLFVGGSAGQEENYALERPLSWRGLETNHRHFTHAHASITLGGFFSGSSAQMLDPAGQWLHVSNVGDATVTLSPMGGFDIFGRGFGDGNFLNSGEAFIQRRLREAFGGAYVLTPYSLLQRLPTDQSYGILDGCFHVQGFDNAAENIVTVDAVDYLTVQNVFRTDIGSYWALRLE